MSIIILCTCMESFAIYWPSFVSFPFLSFLDCILLQHSCYNTFTVTTVSNSRQDIFSWFVWKQSHSCLGVHPCFTEKISRSLKRVILVHSKVTNFFLELTQKYQTPSYWLCVSTENIYYFTFIMFWGKSSGLHYRFFLLWIWNKFFCFTNRWW